MPRLRLAVDPPFPVSQSESLKAITERSVAGAKAYEGGGTLQEAAAGVNAFLTEHVDAQRAAKEPAKRKAGSYKGAAAKPRYNNWFGRANDWSRKIQRVHGRIRFKNQYFK
mgnify:CR=1 FL=1